MRPLFRLLTVLACVPIAACRGGGGRDAGGGGKGPDPVTPIVPIVPVLPVGPTGLFEPASAPASSSGYDVRGMLARHQDQDGLLDLLAVEMGSDTLFGGLGQGDGHFQGP